MKNKNCLCRSQKRRLDILEKIILLQMENLVSTEKTIAKINQLKEELALFFEEDDRNDNNRTPF